MKSNKIIDFSELTNQISKETRIVQCHGVFDLLHIGHIKHFQAAKKHGDILIVTITPDRFVNKGPSRPRFTERLRAEAVAALDCVDLVIINQWPTAVEAIQIIKPHIYVKGEEYKNSENDLTGKIEDEMNSVRQIGGNIVFTDDVTFSSSALINEYFSPFSGEVLNYLNTFKKQHSFSMIYSYFKQIEKLKVLVIGEAILDWYRFASVLGKSGKESNLVIKYHRSEMYAGGIVAIANHLADFCQEITCLTYLGEKGEHEDIMQKSVSDNVKMVPIYKKNSPTIIKKRFLDEYLQQKLFEEYEINDEYLVEEQQKIFLDHLKMCLSACDVVIVCDYGHGLLNEEAITYITDHAKFLAVNTQANAGNHGFNCIDKYNKANHVVVASRELQLNYRQKELSIPEQLSRLMMEQDYQSAVITGGKEGVYVCKRNEPIFQAPALATKIVDRVGAGDAVLALTSLFSYCQAPSELIGFIGNVAGAEAVQIMGNKSAIKKLAFLKHIDHLLK